MVVRYWYKFPQLACEEPALAAASHLLRPAGLLLDLATLVPVDEEHHVRVDHEAVDQHGDDVAQRALRERDRASDERSVRAGEHLVGTPLELVGRPEDPGLGDDAVGPEHAEEREHGAQHRLAPGDRRAGGALLAVPEHDADHGEDDEKGPDECDHLGLPSSREFAHNLMAVTGPERGNHDHGSSTDGIAEAQSGELNPMRLHTPRPSGRAPMLGRCATWPINSSPI